MTDREATVAACLIVRDASSTLAAAIVSVREHVDEVCVFDTGSTDGTLELLDVLASTPGPPIRVQRGEWRDDFAWAREQSFAMASATWLLWLDADDVLERGHLLRAIVGRADAAGADAILGQYVYAVRRDGSMELVTGLRLVRRTSGYRWAGRAHAELTPPADAGPPLLANPYGIRWIHRRLDVGEGFHLERNARLLRLEVAEPGCRPAAWWHLARSVGGAESVALAGRYLELTSGELSAGRLKALEALGRLDELAAERARFDSEEAWSPAAMAAADARLSQAATLDVGRNERCLCLSGRKARACCGEGRVPWPLLVGLREGAVVDV